MFKRGRCASLVWPWFQNVLATLPYNKRLDERNVNCNGGMEHGAKKKKYPLVRLRKTREGFRLTRLHKPAYFRDQTE